MKKIAISLSLLSVLFILSACSSQAPSYSAGPAPVNSITPTTTSSPIALLEVAKHNTATDCWTAINGNVYDITPYIKMGVHPGGDKILQACGIEATTIFNANPKHGDKARGNLDSYFIGKVQ